MLFSWDTGMDFTACTTRPADAGSGHHLAAPTLISFFGRSFSTATHSTLYKRLHQRRLCQHVPSECSWVAIASLHSSGDFWRMMKV